MSDSYIYLFAGIMMAACIIIGYIAYRMFLQKPVRQEAFLDFSSLTSAIPGGLLPSSAAAQGMQLQGRAACSAGDSDVKKMYECLRYQTSMAFGPYCTVSTDVFQRLVKGIKGSQGLNDQDAATSVNVSLQSQGVTPVDCSVIVNLPSYDQGQGQIFHSLELFQPEMVDNMTKELNIYTGKLQQILDAGKQLANLNVDSMTPGDIDALKANATAGFMDYSIRPNNLKLEGFWGKCSAGAAAYKRQQAEAASCTMSKYDADPSAPPPEADLRAEILRIRPILNSPGLANLNSLATSMGKKLGDLKAIEDKFNGADSSGERLRAVSDTCDKSTSSMGALMCQLNTLKEWKI